ncbi:hypothetical protein [Rhodococcus koreensis]|uniref:hypothetical protein n=1 Tax=Rhodococcus koreensis TaxID=99653 RepID=UPI0036710F95
METLERGLVAGCGGLERRVLAIMSLDPTGAARQRSNRWKAALNAFEITFDGRLPPGESGYK